ncbi:MAG: twin-arginine translocase TatA/TatE family subunit [Candidatus Acidiferrales bacterium]
MELSPMHLLLILIIVVILFGGRRIPELMRGLGTGINEFKKGMRDEPSTTPPPPPPPVTPVTPPYEEKK